MMNALEFQNTAAFRALVGLVLTMSTAAAAQQDVAWEAAAGISPPSVDPPWRMDTSVLPGTSEPSQAVISFSTAGLVLDAAARPGDRATIRQDYWFSTNSVPPTVVIELELEVSQITPGEQALYVTLEHPALQGRWGLSLGPDDVTVVNRYSTFGSPGSMGAVADSAAIGSTAPSRTYRLEVDPATNQSTLVVDGAQVFTLQGVQSPVQSSPAHSVWIDTRGSRLVVRRIEHTLGGDTLQVCQAAQAPTLSFAGSALLAAGNAEIRGWSLPPAAQTVPLFSTIPAPPVAAGPIQGLCLGRPFYRILPGGQPLVADAMGQVTVPLDPGAIPFPGGPRPLSAGEALYVQLWYRDPAAPAQGALTGALRIEFR